MTSLDFFKYEGAGNDFILIDDRNNLFYRELDQNLIKKLCDRRFGIGADGLMILRNHAGFDFEMVYYNADGREGTMCGNGGRCIASFARYLGVVRSEANFLAVDGPHYAKISEDLEWVRLQITEVDNVSRDGEAYVLNTGSPHYVLECTQLSEKDVYNDGRMIRNSGIYQKDGINVNFVEDRADHYFVRTFERGVEDETFACGTGVTAVAMAMALKKGLRGTVMTNLKAMGGDLKVEFSYDGDRFTSVYLEGPAKQVFRGSVSGLF